MAFAIDAGRHPKFPTHQPITKSMYFLPRESVTMLPLVAAICSSAGSSLARGSWRRAGMSDPFRAQLWRRCHFGIRTFVIGGCSRHHPPAILNCLEEFVVVQAGFPPSRVRA